MARSSFKSNKRQKELAKKEKKELKRQRKIEKKAGKEEIPINSDQEGLEDIES
ncbi:MAG: hypothetical protein K9J85_08340 [Desulfobacteraceae bacterium]|nr:hypothetical protein [Desulfobacteraceae bacterium]